MASETKSHFTWSIESPIGHCPFCLASTLLITALPIWSVHESDDNEDVVDELGGSVDVSEEVSGHFCHKCGKLTSLSLNT